MYHAYCFVTSRRRPKFVQLKLNALFYNNVEFERTLIIMIITAPK